MVSSIAKRQHYHMRFILRNFAVRDMLQVFHNAGGVEALSYEDKLFYGYKSWSDEAETGFGAEIERKMQGQTRHILKTLTVSSHVDISRYHLLWRFRHIYAINPEAPMQVFEDFGFGSIQEVKDWANANGKIYINGDGTIDGLFAATLLIEEGIKRYFELYDGVFWHVGVADEGGLISADCYRNQLIFPISPNVLLFAKRSKAKKLANLCSEDVVLANEMAREQCHAFCFGLPGDPMS